MVVSRSLQEGTVVAGRRAPMVTGMGGAGG